MSDTTTTDTATDASASEATPPRARMSMAQKYALMHLIHTEYLEAGLGDAAFARHATDRLGFKVWQKTVASYCDGFGIKVVKVRTKAPTPAELQARIAELEAKLAQVVTA